MWTSTCLNEYKRACRVSVGFACACVCTCVCVCMLVCTCECARACMCVMIMQTKSFQSHIVKWKLSFKPNPRFTVGWTFSPVMDLVRAASPATSGTAERAVHHWQRIQDIPKEGAMEWGVGGKENWLIVHGPPNDRPCVKLQKLAAQTAPLTDEVIIYLFIFSLPPSFLRSLPPSLPLSPSPSSAFHSSQLIITPTQCLVHPNQFVWM